MSIATVTTFRREVVPSITVAKSLISNARLVTVQKVRVALVIGLSADRAHSLAEPGEDYRQLLAVRPDIVRLYPARHATERAAITQ
jgi:hypothetical protein